MLPRVASGRVEYYNDNTTVETQSFSFANSSVKNAIVFTAEAITFVHRIL